MGDLTKMTTEGWKRLYLSGGILVCYSLLGIAQETITKASYGDEKFRYQPELVFVMCLSNLIFAYATGEGRSKSDKTPFCIYLICGLSYVGAMLCSNYALAHISYPVQVLGKSCKPVAVMAVCLLLRQKSYALQKYLCVLTIVAGVVVFLYNPKKAGNTDGVTIGTGELWILASLTLDGCVASCQEYMKRNFQSPKSNMMLNLNLISLVFLTSQSVWSGSLCQSSSLMHSMVGRIGPLFRIRPVLYLFNCDDLWPAVVFDCDDNTQILHHYYFRSFTWQRIDRATVDGRLPRLCRSVNRCFLLEQAKAGGIKCGKEKDAIKLENTTLATNHASLCNFFSNKQARKY